MRKLFISDFASELGSTIVAGITSNVKPTRDLNELRKGDSLIGTTLRLLDQMSDEELIEEASQLIVSSASDYLSAFDAETIRDRTAIALVEAILEGNK
jgi:hypothetical protein